MVALDNTRMAWVCSCAHRKRRQLHACCKSDLTGASSHDCWQAVQDWRTTQVYVLDDVIAGLRGNDVGGSANSSAAGSGFGMLVYSWGYRVLCFLFLGRVVLKGIVVLLDKKVMSNSYILNTQSLNIKPFSLNVKTRDPKPYSPNRVQECIL